MKAQWLPKPSCASRRQRMPVMDSTTSNDLVLKGGALRGEEEVDVICALRERFPKAGSDRRLDRLRSACDRDCAPRRRPA
jgi:hypothetical protein